MRSIAKGALQGLLWLIQEEILSNSSHVILCVINDQEHLQMPKQECWCPVHCAVSHSEMELTFTYWFLPTPLPIALADPVGTANQLKSHFAFILHSVIKSGATINQGEGSIGKGLWNAAINHCS